MKLIISNKVDIISNKLTDSNWKLISTSNDWFKLTNEDILRLEQEASDKQKDGEGFIKDE